MVGPNLKNKLGLIKFDYYGKNEHLLLPMENFLAEIRKFPKISRFPARRI
jgi:hypothetical protein